MKHLHQPLRFPLDALAPYVSGETMEYHWGKHLLGYLNNLNKLIEGTEFEDYPLERIISESKGSIFNNGAQVYNHNFFFEALSETAQLFPMGNLLLAIDRDFGSFDKFKERFELLAQSIFGSGWCWLVSDDQGVLDIRAYSNAGNPLQDGLSPLLTVDVWEHAYYIDYRNRRADFLRIIWTVTDWEVVEQRYALVLADG